MAATLLANNKYRATLRSIFIDGVDTTLSVTAIPTNIPTLVTVGWNTQYETTFSITGTSGTNSSNYALTGIVKIRGFSGNLPENTAVNCLNDEQFFNQYGEKMATVESEVNAAITTLTPTPSNLLNNGNFINNSTNGYGSTPDDWTNSNANPVQGGFPSMTKQELIDLLGVSNSDIQGLWNLNGNFNDLSANGYNLTGSGSPTDSNDGFMGQCKSFVGGSSQYASVTAANCDIVGNQTWFGWVKISAYTGTNSNYIGIGDGTNFVRFRTATSAGDTTQFGITFELSGITGTVSTQLNNGGGFNKWTFIVCVYDQSNGKIKVWLNGCKRIDTTCTGSHTASSGHSLKLNADQATSQFNTGTYQNFGMLSTALTDTQIKKLWAATTYKGQKIRRATTDAALTQSLPQDLVERLRGKTITLKALMYQSVASTGTLSINDGSATTSSTSITIGSWITVSVTKTISTTATAITVSCNHSTSDGNTWFKEVSLYEGSNASVPYDHSKLDWSRFPRLLKMNPPAVISGYQYEEKLWLTTTSIISIPANGIDDGAGGQPTIGLQRMYIDGNIVRIKIEASGTKSFTSRIALTLTEASIPTADITQLYNGHNGVGTAYFYDGTNEVPTVISFELTTLYVYFIGTESVTDNTVGLIVSGEFSYPIA